MFKQVASAQCVCVCVCVCLVMNKPKIGSLAMQHVTLEAVWWLFTSGLVSIFLRSETMWYART